MEVGRFFNIIGANFYTGVPDSQLKPVCDYLIDKFGDDPKHHIITANEGNSTALAAGYHLATGKIPVVYLQNSGEGNIINPVVSLCSKDVYAIPMVFLVGWRGEPGIQDEPQHIYQGGITIRLLEDMGIEVYILSEETTEKEVLMAMERFRRHLETGKDVAFVIRKGALTYDRKVIYKNHNKITREDAIRFIVEASDGDPIISTTGKASRELFEIRDRNRQGHEYDFLSVGSMGHSSSIALGVALHRPEKCIWCIDGDGAALMHLGAMAVIGASALKNMIHVLINNEAHESVGGMPTVAGKIDFTAIAKACGYPNAVCVRNVDELIQELALAKHRKQLCFIEVRCLIGARSNLGRPTISTIENKREFMRYIGSNSKENLRD